MTNKWQNKVQAADYMHTDPGMIDQLVATGRLTCSVFDGKELFLIDHLDQYLLSLQRGRADQEGPPSAPTPQQPPLPATGTANLAARPDCPRQEVEDTLQELESKQSNPKQHAKILTRELRKSLKKSDFRSIPRSVGERLARWCTPARDDERTRFVAPLARRLSELLFGYVLARQD
jgi:hypothetical protein